MTKFSPMTLPSGELSEDAWAFLTPEMATKFKVLLADFRRDRAAQSAAVDAHQQAVIDHQAEQAEFEFQKGQYRSLNLTAPPALLAEHEAKVSRKGEARDTALKASQVVTAKSTRSRAVLVAVADYVNSASGLLNDAPEIDTTLSPGKTDLDVVRETERQKANLKAEATRVKASREGPDVDNAAFEVELDKLAAEPDFELIWLADKLTIRFPTEVVDAEGRGGRVPVAFDGKPAYIRAHRSEILQKAKQVISGEYDYNNVLVMTPEQKRARLREIADELLKCDRSIAGHVWAARAMDQDLAFDATLDPRAVLGVEGPPPARRRP